MRMFIKDKIPKMNEVLKPIKRTSRWQEGAHVVVVVQKCEREEATKIMKELQLAIVKLNRQLENKIGYEMHF